MRHYPLYCAACGAPQIRERATVDLGHCRLCGSSVFTTMCPWRLTLNDRRLLRSIRISADDALPADNAEDGA